MASAKQRRPTRPADKPKEWMTSGEVARAMNMTDAAIRRWAREGLVEAIKTPGGQYRFRRDALARLLQVRHVNGPAPHAPRKARSAP